MNTVRIAVLLVLACLVRPVFVAADNGTPAGPRYRVLVSTDIGGTDFDDFQSMVHLLLYADSLDIEGLVSSPYGPGRKEHILKVIESYERDYPNLTTYSDKYPTPDALRALTKQGALETADRAGFATPTEGSDWIVTCARRDDPRPLHVLVWGGIEDLAQALHDAPDILPRLRVYFIGGPNKKWSVDAYHYIATHHPTLWIIEANETYRGWFEGGNQDGDLGNESFVAAHIAGRGALGEFFAKGISFDSKVRSTVKMGDSPSVGWLLQGNPADPSQPGWGGQFVRAWERPHLVCDRLTTTADRIEQFGVFELALNMGDRAPGRPEARMQIENQSLPGTVDAQGVLRFRFSPKEAKEYRYTIRANVPALDGRTGALTSVKPQPDAALRPSPHLPNWWTDDPAPAAVEGSSLGARTVSRWREAFLRDFAERLRRTTPSAKGARAQPRAQVPDVPRPRPRVIVTTDIGGDPDDAMSMVRFLTYANQWDVEGLIATAYQRTKVEPQHIRAIVDAYAKVQPNLERHETGYPSPEQLLSVVREGRPAWGMSAVGAGMDSPGSDLIIAAVDRDDARPVWVLVWGGPNCLAQALWNVRASRPAEAVSKFVARLRVYAISDQDDSGPWIREHFPALFYIASPGMHAGGGFHHSTWIGIGGDRFHGRFGGADFTIVDNPWLDQHVRTKGPLGAMYPQWKFMMEGDTPSFLYLVDNGLGDPEHPDWGSWGGRYELYTPRNRKWMIQAETRPFWADTEDEVLGIDGQWHTTNKATIWRWRTAYQNDFAARMDWTVRPVAEANHPPVAKLDHASQLAVKAGERVSLGARGSSDPDGHPLRYEWFYYGEPSSILLANGRTGTPLAIEDHDKPVAGFVAPKVSKPETMHIVVAVTDTGTPPLTRYRRVIVTINP